MQDIYPLEIQMKAVFGAQISYVLNMYYMFPSTDVTDFLNLMF